MIFDKFCSVVERHFPEFRYLAENTKVFLFKEYAHTIKPEDTTEEDFNNFVLPFPSVVIEDPATAVILVDSEEGQVGMAGKRSFVDIAPLFNFDNAAFGSTAPVTPEERAFYYDTMKRQGMSEDTIVLAFGEFSHGIPAHKGISLVGGTNRVIVASKEKVYTDVRISPDTLSDELAYELAASGTKNAVAAIEELSSINTKKNFVLEESPINPKLHKDRIPRTHQRPLYTILDARSIRKKMGTLDAHNRELEEGRKRNSPIPHERRRHPRRLSSAGGHYKEDKVIIIPAVWIGQSEARVGKKIYKVRLDV